MRRRFVGLFTHAFLPLGASLPVPQAAESASFLSVDASQDAWAQALSGIGPLILLIGEKNTKQLLREANGLPGILSMSFAPIGLLSVLTSMIRLCGSQKLRSYIGYEHEPRATAAIEMTRVNCGGVHAEVVDGMVSRSTSTDATSKALAVLFLRGESEATDVALKQIQHCYKFQAEKTAKGCPEAAGNVNWCMRTTFLIESTDLAAVSRVVSCALNMPEVRGSGFYFSSIEQTACGSSETNTQEADIVNVPTSQQGEELMDMPKSERVTEEGRPVSMHVPEDQGDDKDGDMAAPSALNASTAPPAQQILHRPLRRSTDEKLLPQEVSRFSRKNLHLPRPLKSTFFCTFDGVSEVSTSTPTPRGSSVLVAVSSFVAMIALQIICLW